MSDEGRWNNPSCATPFATRYHQCGWVQANATPSFVFKQSVVTQGRELPARYLSSGTDGVHPSRAVGAQHARYIQSAATTDIAQRPGLGRATVETAQYTQHRLGTGMSEDDPRHTRREEPVQSGIIHHKLRLPLVLGNAQ